MIVILCMFAAFALGAIMGYALGRISKEDEKLKAAVGIARGVTVICGFLALLQTW